MRLKALCLIIISFMVASCGTMRVYVNHDSTYSRKNPITIISESDESGALGELQFQLQSNGYKLMSMTAAKKALNLDTDTSSNSVHSEFTNTTTVRSVYVLEMSYSYYWDTFYYAFTNFSATITDLETGEIIMTGIFRGDKSVRSVITELVNEMNKVIR